MLRVAVAVVLIAHGLGHALGILPLFGIKLSGTHAFTSWLVTEQLGGAATRGLGLTLWLAALIGFVVAGLGLLDWLVPPDSWQPLAIAAALASLVAIALFWGGLPFFFPNKVGAIAVDLAVLVSLLWLRWPPGVVKGMS
ncbi:MAG: hypothetical protein JSU87_02560 [Gemmatimonadota bacterium]|nr:MAG: hypothetical protein JSU87_02560 [Gemmatimonadota bacterium]